MMLTAHAVLAQRYARRAEVLDLSLLAVTIVLCLAAFADPAILPFFRLTPESSRIALGIISAVAFFLSLMQWRVDWKQLATEHSEAMEQLSRQKVEWRERISRPGSQSEQAQWLWEAALELRKIKPIPESQFHVLKARHKRKVAVSQLIDRYPGVPIPILRMRIAMRDLARLAQGEREGVLSEPDRDTRDGS